MIIQMRCSGCDKSLETVRVEPTAGRVDVIVEVKPCGNIDCYDCSGCEAERENKKLKDAIKELATDYLGMVAKSPTKQEGQG